MLAATFFDPVVGLDVHVVAVPAVPSPIPTPMPMPFVGMVFDPAGLAIGAAIGTALTGSPGLVTVNSMFAGNAGTAVTNMMTAPHLPVPGPFMMGLPGNDAETMFGGFNAKIGGSFGLRLGDFALSCSDPIRMPTSAVLAIPKGMPVFLLRPSVPDVQMILMGLAMKAAFKVVGAILRKLARGGASVFRMLRTIQRRPGSMWKRVADRLHAVADRLLAKTERLRGFVKEAICFVTGHPVDVATGRMFTNVADFELPGPIPLEFVRRYDTNRSNRRGVLGYGWSHSLEQSVWLERGRVVLWDADGREIEVQTLDLPGRELRVGGRIEHLAEGLAIKRTSERVFEVATRDGLVRRFADVDGAARESWRAKLVAIMAPSGRAIELAYDRAGLLTHVRDSAGRVLELAYDRSGLLTEVKLPVRSGHGLHAHRRYAYDSNGDLVRVTDSLGHSYRYEYVNHLMVKETDRAGLSFYFAYDGRSRSAKCTRTWGDGGIYDHVIHYDEASRKTIVVNSTLAATVYERDRFNRVVKVVDALGGATTYEYDEVYGLETKSTNAAGESTERVYDARARVVASRGPDGATVHLRYDDRDLLIQATDAVGGQWTWSYDLARQLAEARRPDGTSTRYQWSSGLLTSVQSPEGRVTTIAYDAQHLPCAISGPSGLLVERAYDARGTLVKTRTARGGVTRNRTDSEGRVLETESLAGTLSVFAFDAEGNLLEARDATRHVRLRYGHFHRVIEREEGGTRLRFTYDTEDRLIGLENEAGEPYTFVLDALGMAIEETGFDGETRRYFRDPVGRVVKTMLPSLRTTTLAYDRAGRPTKVEHDDGTSAEFAYRADGLLVRATNVSSEATEPTEIEYERDVLGRVVKERIDGAEIETRYTLDGARWGARTSMGAEWWASHDGLGEVASLSFGRATHGPTGFGMTFERDALGLELAKVLSGGVRVGWERDLAGRPIARRTTRARAHEPVATLGIEGYRWRGDDQIEARIDPVAGPRFFDHDARGRLIRERRSDRVIERAMDAVGNVYRTANGVDRKYGRGGRLESADGVRYEHDADGNQIKKVEPDGTTWQYRWNGAGMLREIEAPNGSLVRFAYDAFARRTKKQRVRVGEDGAEIVERETKFVWDGHVVAHELDSEDGLTTWYWEPETFTPVAKEKGGRRYTIASDHLGTPTEMYDELGELAWKMQLDVFGVPSFDKGTAEDCPWRWPGQYEDRETGLFYNRHRYLEAVSVRFLSRDPLHPWLNAAAYTYPADPHTASDPLGLHQVRATLNGAPVINPARGDNVWTNVFRSSENGMSPTGLGRLGDSENRLMEHLADTARAQPNGLRDGVLKIESIGHGTRRSLPPCALCGEGMQAFADSFRVTVVYVQRHSGDAEVYKPRGGCR